MAAASPSQDLPRSGPWASLSRSDLVRYLELVRGVDAHEVQKALQSSHVASATTRKDAEKSVMLEALGRRTCQSYKTMFTNKLGVASGWEDGRGPDDSLMTFKRFKAWIHDPKCWCGRCSKHVLRDAIDRVTNPEGDLQYRLPSATEPLCSALVEGTLEVHRAAGSFPDMDDEAYRNERARREANMKKLERKWGYKYVVGALARPGVACSDIRGWLARIKAARARGGKETGDPFRADRVIRAMLGLSYSDPDPWTELMDVHTCWCLKKECTKPATSDPATLAAIRQQPFFEPDDDDDDDDEARSRPRPRPTKRAKRGREEAALH